MPTTESAALAALAASVWERTLELNPTFATVVGDERFDDRLDDPGPAGRAARRTLAEDARAGALAIDPAGLDPEERISRDLLVLIADQDLLDDDQRADLVPSVGVQGHPTLLPEIVHLQKVDTPERMERFLARIAEYPAMTGSIIDLLDEGRAAEITGARADIERAIGQVERLLAAPPADSPIVTVPDVAEADRARILEAVERHVRPADTRFLEALRAHLPTTREAPGLCALSDGEARYAAKVRAYTSLDITPAALHQVGLDELARLDEERRAIARDAGFEDDVAGYREHLNAEPAEQPPTPEALVARCQEDVARAFEAAPRWFNRLPKAGCEVRRVEPVLEEDSPGAYYYAPPIDGSRPGIYFVNAYDLPSRAYWITASTTYHEAVPGHHFQLALETELEGLPAFRRLGFWPQGTAYVEGWALYTERLADEMGLFRSEGERFGMLDSQALRAARLVVDTGLHAFGWSRQRAYEAMVAAGVHPTDALIETDRYISWPGQALSYMTGRREIEQLRRERTARDGADFDIRRFHDDVLTHGKLPLRILRDIVMG